MQLLVGSTAPLTILSTTELGTGILSGCLATMRPLFKKIKQIWPSASNDPTGELQNQIARGSRITIETRIAGTNISGVQHEVAGMENANPSQSHPTWSLAIDVNNSSSTVVSKQC